MEGETVRFTLSNPGKPIPRGHRERVFDRFYSLDTSRKGSVGGSGLGTELPSSSPLGLDAGVLDVSLEEGRT